MSPTRDKHHDNWFLMKPPDSERMALLVARFGVLRLPGTMDTSYPATRCASHIVRGVICNRVRSQRDHRRYVCYSMNLLDAATNVEIWIDQQVHPRRCTKACATEGTHLQRLCLHFYSQQGQGIMSGQRAIGSWLASDCWQEPWVFMFWSF